MLGFGSGPPLVLHPAEPAEMFKKLAAKCSLEPGEVFAFWRPITRLPQLLLTKRAESFPKGLRLGKFDAAADEIAALRSEG